MHRYRYVENFPDEHEYQVLREYYKYLKKEMNCVKSDDASSIQLIHQIEKKMQRMQLELSKRARKVSST